MWWILGKIAITFRRVQDRVNKREENKEDLFLTPCDQLTSVRSDTYNNIMWTLETDELWNKIYCGFWIYESLIER